MSKDKKTIVVDVLTKFFQSSLASHNAREWIAEEIIKKLDDETYEVSVTSPRDERKSMEKGLFETYISNIAETNAKINEKVQLELDDKQKEILGREPVKDAKDSKKQIKPPVDGKNVKKVKPKKNYKEINKRKFL